jgi:DNA-binding transcriptional MerR regulator
MSIATLRFYETEGLIVSSRTEGNYRDFPEEAVIQAERIRSYRSLQLSLPEIKAMLRLDLTPSASCGQVCDLIGQHLQKVAQQRQQLQDLESELERLLALCSGSSERQGCQILAELGQIQ